MKQWWNSLSLTPERLFLLFAVPYGLILVFLIPLLGGSDENFHFQRIASIAYLEILNRSFLAPEGIIRFFDVGADFFSKISDPPFHYSYEAWQKIFNIPLNARHSVTINPLPVTIHHPFSYIPQIIAFALTASAGLPPAIILYANRLAGLAAGIYLTWLAIRLMPTGKYMLCAIALLPTITFYRSYVNADSFTNGLAFLLLAFILREITAPGIIRRKTVYWLAITAFLLAQAKNAYLFLPFMALAIPTERFPSQHSHIRSLALITLPGALASVTWMLLIKHSYFSNGVSYHTWGGEVNPQAQTQFILSHPIQYLLILTNTLCFTLTVPDAFTSLFNEVGLGYSLPLPIILVLLLCILKITLLDWVVPVRYSKQVRTLGGIICLGVLFISFTILYIQWTGLQDQTIKGFQGRYLFPMLPLITLFVEPSDQTKNAPKNASYIALLGILGLSATIIRVWLNYY